MAFESYLKSSSSLSENDGYTSEVTLDFEQKVRLRSLQKPRRIDNYNQRTKEESKQTNNPDWTSVQQTWESSTMDMDFKSFQHMEKSLEVAENNLEHLKSMEEITQHLMTQAKLEEGRTADIINTKFAHLTASLNSSFYMDCDEITHVLENMGAVSCDVPNVSKCR